MLKTLSLIFLGIFSVCVLLEFIWSRATQRQIYSTKESLCNVGIYAVFALIRPLAAGWVLLIFAMLAPIQLFALPETPWVFALTFIATDFTYYWYHRFTHELPILWTMHHTHHSSRNMNLTAAVRLNWVARFITPLFFVPLFILGMSPPWIFASLGLGLIYQFFLHTEAIGKLGWFEGKFLNTPSAHRVHHGCNDCYRDKNYAGALIIWDRLFGTYEEEKEPVLYGVRGFESLNPLTIQFYQLGAWYRSKKQLTLSAGKRVKDN